MTIFNIHELEEGKKVQGTITLILILEVQALSLLRDINSTKKKCLEDIWGIID